VYSAKGVTLAEKEGIFMHDTSNDVAAAAATSGNGNGNGNGVDGNGGLAAGIGSSSTRTDGADMYGGIRMFRQRPGTAPAAFTGTGNRLVKRR
jgi:hypothetical protein